MMNKSSEWTDAAHNDLDTRLTTPRGGPFPCQEERQVEQILQEFTAMYDRAKMLLDLLYEVVERTGNHREGYFALRRINDHGFQLGAIMASGPKEALMQMNNICATIQTEIDRLEKA
jgi:hypothetical protein